MKLREVWDKFTGVAQLSQRLSESEQSETLLTETMTELQLAMEDRGWLRMSEQYDTEFTVANIKLVTRIARVFRLKNPLIKCAIELQANYIFGKGVKITSPDTKVQDELKAFLEANKSELGNHGLWQSECTLRTDGNLFFVLFDDNSTGQVKVRTIDSLEIADKFCNPDDASEVWYFKRVWNKITFDAGTGSPMTEQMTTWYPALGYDKNLLTTIGGQPVEKFSPVLHVKVGGLAKWKFGISEVYAALDWAKAFTMFLSAWATIQESLSRIAVQIKTPGGTKAQARIKTAAGQTTLGNTSGQLETNPPPVTGAWFIGGPNAEIAPILTKNATTAPDEARQLKLQVAAATLTPEHMFGDPSTSNLATAKTLDRPTELKFTVRQELWRDVLETICGYAMLRSAQAPSGRLKEAKKAATDLSIVVTFPPILEHDIKEWVTAVQLAATLDGKALAGTIDPKTLAKMLLSQIPGVENVDDLVEMMYPDASYDPEEWAAKTADEKAAMLPEPTPSIVPAKQKEALAMLGKIIERALAVAA